MKCDWCTKEREELTSVINWGVRYSVCDTCYDRDSKNQCAICGEDVPEGTITGKCIGCKEDEIVKREKERTAILHGVELDEERGSRGQTAMSEDSFERWMVSTDIRMMRVSNEQRRSVRGIWLKFRLQNDYGWTEKEIEDNIEQLNKLVEIHMVKMASSEYYFHLDRAGKQAIPFGYREIGREGSVSILRKVKV